MSRAKSLAALGDNAANLENAIANVADDSTPQLGANLDVVTHSIVTTSNRDINLTPHGTGKVNITSGFYRNLITTVTATGSSTTLSTGQVFTNSYDVYEIYFKNIFLNNDDDVAWIRLLDSSGNGISSSTYGYYNLWLGNSDSDNNQSDSAANNTTAWQITGKEEFAVGNESDEGFSGLIRLYNTRDTSHEVLGGIIDVNYKSVDGYATKSYGSTWRNSTTAAVTGCYLAVFGTGQTITSGSLIVYGYKLGV